MADEEILIRVGIDEAKIGTMIDEITAARAEVDKLRAANKELDRTTAEGAKAFTQNTIRIKEYNQTISQNERAIVSNNKANVANTGSLTQMRQTVNALKKQYADLSKEERENTEVGVKMQREILNKTNELKSLEEQIGVTSRNVGNYREAILQAVGGMKGFGGTLNGIGAMIKTNPIGLLITGFAMLGSKVSAAQGIMDAFNRVLIPINVAFEKLVGLLQDWAIKTWPKVQEAFRGLVEALKQPQVILKQIGDAIQENLINRFNAFGKFIPALKKLISGDLKGGLTDLGNAALQVGTGVEDVIGKVKNAAEGTANFIRNTANSIKELSNEAIRDGERLFQLNKSIQEVEAQNALQREKLSRQIEEQRAIAVDTLLTEEQRAEAAKNAINLINQETALQTKLLNLKIEKARLEASFNDTDRAAQIALNELIAERDTLEARRVSRQKEINTQLSALTLQQKKQAEDEAKALQKEQDEAFKGTLERRVQEFETLQKTELNALKQRYLEGLLTTEQYNQELQDIETAALITKDEIFKTFNEELLKNEALSVEVRKQLQADLQQNIIDSEAAILNARVKTAQEAEKVEKISNDNKIKSTDQTLETAKGLFREESAAYKLLAVGQTTIDTIRAAQAALAPPPVGAGPVLGGILAALVAIKGAAAVAKIQSTPVGFADGVIGLEGAGTATSDSISAKLSKGESVITAKASSVFAPVLAAMESAVGNRPNFGRKGNKRFAAGVIGLGNTGAVSNILTPPQIAPNAQDFSNMQVFVKVTDINRVQAQVANTVRVADI